MKHTVHIEPSGHEITVDDGETVLAAALRQDIALPYSCRNGTCGTCKATLRAGRVDQPGARALSEPERAAGGVLLCQSVPLTDLVVEARELADGQPPIRIMPARVARMQRLAEDVMQLDLKLPQGQRLQYRPGQYLDVLLSGGRRRSFSVANAPEDDEFLQFHIRHVPGGAFSGHVFTDMAERDLLRLQGPYGTFFLREDSTRPVVLVAGGTGFAPIKAIVEHARAGGNHRPMHLYWGVRAQPDLYLGELAAEWARTLGWFRFTPVLSGPGIAPGWTGRTGWVHEAVVADHRELADFDVYMSGPPPMVEAGKKAFGERGLPADQVYSDSFEFSADPGASKP